MYQRQSRLAKQLSFSFMYYVSSKISYSRKITENLDDLHSAIDSKPHKLIQITQIQQQCKTTNDTT